MQHTNHILWNARDLAKAKIPEEAKHFLMTQGLPEWIPYAIEFGLFDGSGEELVIGVHDEYPILVCADGHVEVEGPQESWFFNSSVSQLGASITAYLALREFDEDHDSNQFEELRFRLAEIDGACWQPGSVWHDILREIEGDRSLL